MPTPAEATVVVTNDAYWYGDQRLGAIGVYVDGHRVGIALPRSAATIAVAPALGNRPLNHALHTAAVVHIRYDQRGRAYYDRKKAAGNGSLGALRCLKRRLSDAVYKALVTDQTAKSPGGQMGATLTSSAADLIPMASTSDKPLSGLTADPTPVLAAMS